MPRDDPQILPRMYNERDARMKSHLSFDERYVRIEKEERPEYAGIRVKRLLQKCHQRRAKQPPPPKRIAWEKRPKLNDVITHLATVVGGGPAVST